MNVEKLLTFVLLFVGIVFIVLAIVMPDEITIGAAVACFIMASFTWYKSKSADT
jgi:membrane-bound ClpP family serine protease